jgi:hypothetical protein
MKNHSSPVFSGLKGRDIIAQACTEQSERGGAERSPGLESILLKQALKRRDKLFSRIRRIFILLTPAIVIVSGCRSHAISSCPPAQANYYANPAKCVTAVGRVTLVELANQSAQPQISVDITDSLFESLEKKHYFGLSVLHSTDPGYSQMPQQLAGPLGLEQLELLHKTLQSDSILVGSVTQYTPYPRLAIALRLKLIDLRDGEMIWAIEQVWDTTDKATESRIREYFESEVREGYDPLQYRVAIVSPRMFLKFVAFDVARAMQPK